MEMGPDNRASEKNPEEVKSLIKCLKLKDIELTRCHPEWDYTAEEIFKSNEPLKRDQCPICLPASLHLTGFDDEKLASAEECFDAMKNLEIGGILIGGFDIQNYTKDWQFTSAGTLYKHRLPTVFNWAIFSGPECKAYIYV